MVSFIKNTINIFTYLRNVRCKRSLCSCSVNSGTSTVVTLIVAEAGSSGTEMSEFGDSGLRDGEMVAFLRLGND
jgi:hypothetical protein